MYRLKGWCVEAVQRAVSVLVRSVEATEEQPKKTIHAGAKLEAAQNGHSGASVSKNTHVCRACNVPCVQCVSLQGSSVDEGGFRSHGSEFISKANVIQARSKMVAVSTQTEILSSNLEMTGLPQNSSLPDLLVTSTPSTKMLPPPPPPPPPPPLPPKLQSACTSTLSVARKQQNALKKSQSAGVSVGPEITVELLRNVKLRKLKEVDTSHSNCSLTSASTNVQPAVTLEALQKITLRKTNSVKSIDLGASSIQPETSDCHECGPEDTGTVEQPQKIETRSSSGSHLTLKRRRQPAGEQQSVRCKQRRQSVTNIRLLL